MAILISALILGLMGSFHCVGMCGPIVLALPLHGNNLQQKIYGGLLYNLGRTVTYGIMGAVFGLLGQGLRLVGFQQVVSVLMGSAMIVSVLFPALFRNQYDLQKSSFKLVAKLKQTIAGMFSIRSFQSLFFIGLLNGLLPCGLVYIALAGAIATGNLVTSIWYMVLFGLGTIPMLLALGVTSNVVSARIRQKINQFIPVLVVVVGIFFVLRGLNLNIKYLSPTKDRIEQRFEKSLEEQKQSDTNEKSATVPSCCTQPED
jgi:sulfite exporter TauE/SafE